MVSKSTEIDLRNDKFRSGLRDKLQDEVGKTMANLYEWEIVEQDAFLFTETDTVFAISKKH